MSFNQYSKNMKKSNTTIIFIFIAIIFGLCIPLIQTLITTGQAWFEIIQAKWGKKAEVYIDSMSQSEEIKNPIGFAIESNNDEEEAED